MFTPTYINATCNGEHGIITLAATGGTGTYTFIEGTNTYRDRNISVAAGTYYFQVEDENQCVTSVQEVTVSAPGMWKKREDRLIGSFPP